MRRALPLLGVSVLIAVGASILSIRSGNADGFSSYTPGLTNVTVSGTVDIGTAPRLDTNITNEFVAVAGSSGGARLQVEVPAGVTVTNTVGVTGAVELGPASAALLAGRVCTYGPIGHILLDGGVNDIAGLAGRTGVTLVAHDFGPAVDYVSCWPGNPDGGQSPNCAVGTGGIGMPLNEGGSASFDVSNAYIVRCLACAHAGGVGATTALLGGANSQCTP